MRAAAPWWPYSESPSQPCVKCRYCGSSSALVLDHDSFVCREERICKGRRARIRVLLSELTAADRARMERSLSSGEGLELPVQLAMELE